MPRVKKTFDMAAWQVEQARKQEERRVHAALICKIEAEIRAIVPDDTIAITVKVTHTYSSNRHTAYTDVTGENDSVYRYVRNQFGSDHVVQCYEHMALSLYDVVANDDGTITARLSKNLYAGD